VVVAEEAVIWTDVDVQGECFVPSIRPTLLFSLLPTLPHRFKSIEFFTDASLIFFI